MGLIEFKFCGEGLSRTILMLSRGTSICLKIFVLYLLQFVNRNVGSGPDRVETLGANVSKVYGECRVRILWRLSTSKCFSFLSFSRDSRPDPSKIKHFLPKPWQFYVIFEVVTWQQAFTEYFVLILLILIASAPNSAGSRRQI